MQHVPCCSEYLHLSEDSGKPWEVLEEGQGGLLDYEDPIDAQHNHDEEAGPIQVYNS